MAASRNYTINCQRLEQLVGQTITVEDKELTFISILNRCEGLGIYVYQACWAGVDIIVKSCCVINNISIIGAENGIFNWVTQKTAQPENYPRYLFFTTVKIILNHNEETTFKMFGSEKLGPSLTQALTTVKAHSADLERLVNNIAEQVITILEDLHTRAHVCHFDISTGNIIYRTNSPSTDGKLALIDFGLAHMAGFGLFDKYPVPIGTIAFSSLAMHQGLVCGYTSDLESLAYLLEYIAADTLPWLGITDKEEIWQLKADFDLSKCAYSAIGDMIEYCRCLPVYHTVNYDLLRGLFTGEEVVNNLKVGDRVQVLLSDPKKKGKLIWRKNYLITAFPSKFMIAVQTGIKELIIHSDQVKLN